MKLIKNTNLNKKNMSKKIINISKKQGYHVKRRGICFELYKNDELIDDLYFFDSTENEIVFDSEDTNCFYKVKKNEIEESNQKYDESYFSKENDLSIFKDFNDHEKDILL